VTGNLTEDEISPGSIRSKDGGEGRGVQIDLNPLHFHIIIVIQMLQALMPKFCQLIPKN